MTAMQKIEGLMNSYYGYAWLRRGPVVAGNNGIGFVPPHRDGLLVRLLDPPHVVHRAPAPG